MGNLLSSDDTEVEPQEERRLEYERFQRELRRASNCLSDLPRLAWNDMSDDETESISSEEEEESDMLDLEAEEGTLRSIRAGRR